MLACFIFVCFLPFPREGVFSICIYASFAFQTILTLPSYHIQITINRKEQCILNYVEYVYNEIMENQVHCND